MAAIFSFVNWAARSATEITASSATTQNPVTNLQDDYLRSRHRTLPGITSYSLDLDFGAGKEIGVLALAQPDDAGYVAEDGEAAGAFAATDTVRHRLDLTTLGDGALLDTGAAGGGWVPGYGLHVHALNSAVTARYWRVDIAAPSLVGGPDYCDLGHVWAGPVVQAEIGFSFGWGQQWQDGSGIVRNQRSGLLLSDRGAKFRTLSLGFKNLNDDEANRLFLDMTRMAGLGGLVLCIPDPGGDYLGRQAIIGRLTQTVPIIETDFQRYEATFQIAQAL